MDLLRQRKGLLSLPPPLSLLLLLPNPLSSPPPPFPLSRECVLPPSLTLFSPEKEAPKKTLSPCFSITRFFRGSKERAAPRATYFFATRTNRLERNQPRKKVFLWKPEFCQNLSILLSGNFFPRPSFFLGIHKKSLLGQGVMNHHPS